MKLNLLRSLAKQAYQTADPASSSRAPKISPPELPELNFQKNRVSDIVPLDIEGLPQQFINQDKVGGTIFGETTGYGRPKLTEQIDAVLATGINRAKNPIRSGNLTDEMTTKINPYYAATRDTKQSEIYARASRGQGDAYEKAKAQLVTQAIEALLLKKKDLSQFGDIDSFNKDLTQQGTVIGDTRFYKEGKLRPNPPKTVQKTTR